MTNSSVSSSQSDRIVRVPNGVPSGGQFSFRDRTESSTALSPLRRVGKALRTVLPVALVAVLLPSFALSPTRAEARPAGENLRVLDLNTNFDLSDGQWLRQMNKAKRQNPDVMLLQETQWRDIPLRNWARKNGYNYIWPGEDARQQSTVLWKRSRFQFKGFSQRLGSRRVVRADGSSIPPRYITTVRLQDRASKRKFAFSSTHAVPEVMWWPGQAGFKGAPRPFKVMPRKGTRTLAAFKRHVKAIDAQVRADKNAGYVSVVGVDLNAGHEYEAGWGGFQTDTFGNRAISNHTALGQKWTYSDENGGRTIDYVFLANSPKAIFRAHKTVKVPSDHHALVTDIKVRRR